DPIVHLSLFDICHDVVDALKSNWLSSAFDGHEPWSKDALVPVSFDKRVNCVPVGRDSRALEDPMVVLQASRSSDSLSSSLDCLVVGPFRVFYTECNISDAVAVRENEPCDWMVRVAAVIKE